MPDVKEVYEMVTKQKPSDPGALERQRTRQVRTMRNRKIGAFGVAAAIGVAAVAVILASRPRDNLTTPLTPGDATAEEVATGFVEAYGAFDADRVMSYLADDTSISALAWGGDVDQFRLVLSLHEAQGQEITLDSCEELGSSASVTNLRCTYDFHTLRSDEIGRGPFSGSYFDLIVRDGEIAHVGQGHFEIEEFSPQMWEPFTDWVYQAYPEDAAVMYEEPRTLERLSEESIRLWERHTRDYVEEVKQGGAGQ